MSETIDPDRAAYLRANAVAVVATLEAKVQRQAAELARLNKANAGLRGEVRRMAVEAIALEKVALWAHVCLGVETSTGKDLAEKMLRDALDGLPLALKKRL